MNTHAKTALSLILIQLTIIILTGALTLWLAGPSPAVGALAGGGICLLATAVFSLRIFSGGIEFEPRRFMRRLFVAEMQKILLTVFLFIAAIKWTQLHHAGLLLGFMSVTLLGWLMLPLAVTCLTNKSKSKYTNER